jgi:hypothetical protein
MMTQSFDQLALEPTFDEYWEWWKKNLGEFAEALWPFQFAISIPGGIQLLTHCF